MTAPCMSTLPIMTDAQRCAHPRSAQEYILWQSVTSKLSHITGSSEHILIRVSSHSVHDLANGERDRTCASDSATLSQLLPGGSELVTIAPVLAVDDVKFAAIGLCELFNPGAAVLSCSLEPKNGSTKISMGVRYNSPPATYLPAHPRL